MALALFRAVGFVTDAPEAWAALPGELTLWRGTEHPRPMGLAWTLDRDTAVWFGRRYTGHLGSSTLLQGVLHKRDALAFLTDRAEAEVVVNPRRIHVVARTDAMAAAEDGAHERVVGQRQR